MGQFHLEHAYKNPRLPKLWKQWTKSQEYVAETIIFDTHDKFE